MVKAYLKYEFSEHYGLINSCEASSIFDHEGKTIFSAANEFIYQYSPRTNERLLKLGIHEDNLDLRMHTVTSMRLHPFNANVLAAGYHNGTIVLWNLELQSRLSTFYGHKSKVNVLHFSLDGHLLVSGGADTEIVVWDVTSHIGLFRLCGHSNQITGLRFLHKTIQSYSHRKEGIDDEYSLKPKHKTTQQDMPEFYLQNKKKKHKSDKGKNDEVESQAMKSSVYDDTLFTHLSTTPSYLLSASKDGTVKLWDLAAQWCIQTVFDSSGEIHCLLVNPLETRFLVGNASREIRVFSITHKSREPASDPSCLDEVSESFPTINEVGLLARPSHSGRIIQMVYVTDPAKLFVHYRKCGYRFFSDSKQESSTDSLRKDQVMSCYGTLFTQNKTHAGCQAFRQFILALDPDKKCIEVYVEFSQDECKKRYERRLKRHKKKLKEKMKKLKELNHQCEEFEKQLGSGKRTAVGTTYEVEREALLHKIELATVESQRLKNEYNIKDAFFVGDEVCFLHKFSVKKSLHSMDYHMQSHRLLLTYRESYLSVFTLPLDLLTKLKSKVSRQVLQNPDTLPIDPEQLVLKEGSENICEGHPGALRCVFISHDDAVLATLAKKLFFMWNLDTTHLIFSLELKSKGTCGFFVVGNAHTVIGTSKGEVLLLDVSTHQILYESLPRHDGAVNAIAEHPKHTGFVTVGADKKVCFFRFKVVESLEGKMVKKEVLEYDILESIDLPDEGLDVKVTPDAKHLAVALLDFTIQIFFLDTMKVFLTLYGHKLPCTCLDISSDCSLVVTGSCDKTLKLWGLDFGNIQRSWHAHEEDITQVQFIKHTHYIVSGGKDGQILFWDGDTGEFVHQLQYHSTPVVSLRATHLDADRLVAGMMDGSLRLLTRTDAQVFACEEREKLLESQLMKKLVNEDASAVSGDVETFKRPSRKTVVSLQTTDQLLQTLELCAEAFTSLTMYKEALLTWKRSMGDAKDGLSVMTKPVAPALCTELLGVSPHHYLYRIIGQIPSSLHYEIVVSLPFVFVEKLLGFLGDILEEQHLLMNKSLSLVFNMDYPIEAVARISLLLIHLHARQFMAFPASRHHLVKIHQHLRPLLLCQKEVFEQNTGACTIFQHVHEASRVL